MFMTILGSKIEEAAAGGRNLYNNLP